MTVAAPPRPPRHEVPRALNEQALIEEARLRARRRRRGYAAAALLAAGAAAAAGFARGSGHSAGAAPAAPRAASVTAAANGKLAFAGWSGALQTVNADGSGLKTVVRCRSANCATLEPAWSPDGTHIAFVRGTFSPLHHTTKLAVYVAGADGTHLRQLAPCGSCGEQFGAGLAWSPDGRSITFSRNAGRHGRQSLWRIALTGGRPRQLTRCASCVDIDPVWSPDGRSIAFYREAAGGSAGVYTIRPDGSALTRVVAGAHPQWSPDGRRIAFDGAGGVGVVDVDGRSKQLLFSQANGAGPGVPSWSPDGTRLAFFNTPGTPGHFWAEVWTMKPDGSGRKRVFRSPCCIGTWTPPVFSPDGRLIAVSEDAVGGVFVIKSDGSGVRRVSRVVAAGLSWQRR